MGAGNRIDWDNVVDRINAAYGTDHKDVRSALEDVLNRNFGICARSAKAAGVSIHTLKPKLKSLGMEWNRNPGIRIVDGEVAASPIRKTEIIEERINKIFDREAWVGLGRKSSPCRYCSNSKGDKNNVICERECPEVEEYDLFISSGLSSADFDRFISGRNVSIFSISRPGFDTMRESLEVRL
jgi:hypothetical protein